MTSETSSSTYNEEYRPLPTDDTSNKQSTYTYYVIPTQPLQKKQCGGICCLFCLVTFLLCFFLIPHQPSAVLNELSINSNGYCTGNFKFINYNYYKTIWENPKISLYWVPYNGQTVGQACYNDGNYCDKKIHQVCAIKIGNFKSNYKFKIEAKSSKIKELNVVNSTSQELACIAWMLLNPYENFAQRLLTSGHVHVKSDINDFGNVNVKEEYYYIN